MKTFARLMIVVNSRKSAKRKEQNEMLQRRLDGLEDVKSW